MGSPSGRRERVDELPSGTAEQGAEVCRKHVGRRKVK